MMDSPTSVTSAADEPSRLVKFLCSFGGSILPRPLDGRLRYVGGETRIVTVARDATFAAFLARMKEIFDSAAIVKYQQPDEDLDTLVSIVNDDDLMNMMEEYDKVIASGEGFTRLRIFLFPLHANVDSPSGSVHYDGDERGAERRYLDALNSLGDVRSPASSDSDMGFSNHLGLHHLNVPSPSSSQRYGDPDSPWSPAFFSPGHYTVHDAREYPPSPPSATRFHVGEDDFSERLQEEFLRQSSQLRQYENQSPTKAESMAWLPPGAAVQEKAGFPGNLSRTGGSIYGNNYNRAFHRGAGLLTDARHVDPHWKHAQPHIEQYSTGNECICCYPIAGADFGSMEHGMLNHDTRLEGVGFGKDQYNYRQGFYDGNQNPDKGLQLNNNQGNLRYDDPRLHRSGSGRTMGSYIIDNNVTSSPSLGRSGSGRTMESNATDSDLFRSTSPSFAHSGSDRMIDPYSNAIDGNRTSSPSYTPAGGGLTVERHAVEANVASSPSFARSGSGRMVEPFVVANSTAFMRTGSARFQEVEGNIAASPSYDHGKIFMHPAAFNHVNLDNSQYVDQHNEINSQLYHSQLIGGGASYVNPSFEDASPQHHNHNLLHGGDSFFQIQRRLAPIQPSRRVRSPVRADLPYEMAGSMVSNGGSNSYFARNTPDGSPRMQGVMTYDRVESQWPMHVDSSSERIMGPDNFVTGLNAQPYFYSDQDLVQGRPGMPFIKVSSEQVYADTRTSHAVDDLKSVRTSSSSRDPSRRKEAIAHGEINLPNSFLDVHETSNVEALNGATSFSGPKMDFNAQADARGMECKGYPSIRAKECEPEVVGTELGVAVEKRLSLLPELIASVQRIALEDVEKDKEKDPPIAVLVELPNCDNEGSNLNEKAAIETGEGDLESDSCSNGEHQKTSKIETTSAEAEALAKGLQTIKNDDLEEIRELGSGTFGSVYYGKWKGSDVAIKRIKASCFTGKPSERERLISEFWKEALLLSSLHHPNVVSFYGVVRDGPDGSLATVTEFMVNGSLKQFLQKKDRTIDRRKRLILAMDTSFGMEYLHGRNIVHFDLKCENLLVNMRDPHRPICKIGDLGLSKVKQYTLVSGGIRGTLPWMAPELLSGKSKMVSEKIDVYSFGVVMWELLTGEEPYADMRCASIIGGIVNNTLRPEIPTWCDPEWKALMVSCWASDPGERPSFSEISQRLRKMAAAINVK